jgi:anti-anti-sigma regulatory factor
MLSTQAFAPATRARVAVVVDLIGDLDSTLGDIFAATLDRLTQDGTTDLYLKTRHVAVTSTGGMAALGDALATARERGCSIAIEPGNRRMRAAFSQQGIAYAATAEGVLPRNARHLMIARHAEAQAKTKLRRTA